jgi:hypothetical protein
LWQREEVEGGKDDLNVALSDTNGSWKKHHLCSETETGGSAAIEALQQARS